MIKTRKMHKIAEYNHFNVIEAVYRRGSRLYMSIIDHRLADTRLDGIYDELGVYPVDPGYVQKWADCRGITGLTLLP